MYHDKIDSDMKEEESRIVSEQKYMKQGVITVGE